MPNIGRVTIGQTGPKNVIVKQTNRTTISSPNFEPKVNISISDIQSLNVSVRKEGDVILYDAETDEYKSSPISSAILDITNINGGTF